MEETLVSSRQQLSQRLRMLRYGLFVVVVLLWLTGLQYLLAAYFLPELPIGWGVFMLFGVLILTPLLPALALSFPRTPTHPKRVSAALWMILVGVFWIFGPLYEYLSLYETSRVGIWLLILNYWWEVPLLGGVYIQLVSRAFFKQVQKIPPQSAGQSPEAPLVLRHTLIAFPLRAAMAFFLLITMGLGFGLTSAHFLLKPSPLELLKNAVNVGTLAFLAALLIFFALHHLRLPFCAQIPARTLEPPPFPLKRKLVLLVTAMSVFAFLIYVPVALKQLQLTLGSALTDQAHTLLKELAKNVTPPFQDPQNFLNATQPYTLGARGYILLSDKTGAFLTPHPQGARTLQQDVRWPDLADQILRGISPTVVHFRGTRYFVSLPYGPFLLFSVIQEQDFVSKLYPLLYKSGAVALVFAAVLTLLLTFFVAGIARPVAALARSARAIVSGQDIILPVVRTGDEIEILAEELQQMTRRLREYELGLEAKIAQRTQELSATNATLKEKGLVLEHVLADVQKADEELQRLNRAKSEFISLASHQLRTPLTAIKWYGSIFAQDGLRRLSVQQKRAFRQMREANERMLKLINALLNVSRIELGTLAVNPAPVELNSWAQSLRAELTPLARRKKITLQWKFAAVKTLRTDVSLLTVIASNLITNAIAYTPPGGRVEVRFTAQGRRGILTVRDTGYGIPAAEQNKIFSKLYRGSNIVEKEPFGTGLGLYIVQAATEALQGTIAFQSQENKGTTFTLNFPLTLRQGRAGVKGLLPML